MEKLKKKMKDLSETEKTYLKEKLWLEFQESEGFYFEIDAYDFIEETTREIEYLEDAYKKYNTPGAW